MLPHRFLTVTTTSVSDEAGLKNAIENCDSDTTCEIEVKVDIDITATLDVVGKTLVIKSTKDGSRAVLDGGGTEADPSLGTQVLKLDVASTVTIDGVAIKNGYSVSPKNECKNHIISATPSALSPPIHQNIHKRALM